MIRDTVRQFVREQLLPNVAEWFERGILPRELALELGKLGLLGMHLEGYGCAGASSTSYGLTCMELEAGDSGLRSLVSVQGSWRCSQSPVGLGGAENAVAAANGGRQGDRLLRANRARGRI